MTPKLKRTFEQLIPLIVLGIVLVLATTLLVIFSYVVIWGVIIGCGVWLILLVKNTFFSSASKEKTPSKPRIIEHDDLNK